MALAGVVLVGHQGLLPRWPKAPDFAVQVFFALSGWLIGGILVKMPSTELPRFYFNRALRIWCPYLLALGLLTAATLLHDPITAKRLEFLFYKLTFVYNLFGIQQLGKYAAETPLQGTGNHFWSVNAEEQFYLLAPLILVVSPKRLGRSVIIWAAIAAVAWRMRSYASIAFGVLAAVSVNRCGSAGLSRGTRALMGMMAGAAAAGMAAGGDYELLAPFCAIGIVLLLASQGRQDRWGELVGGISYPLYLNAWIAVFLVNAVWVRSGWMKSGVLYQTVVALSSLALAVIFYCAFDRRILAARSKLYRPTRARILLALAYSTAALGVFVGVFMRVHS